MMGRIINGRFWNTLDDDGGGDSSVSYLLDNDEKETRRE